nr:hypothetical protein [Tanacetum cinerariifolium]
MFVPSHSTVPKLQTAEDLQGDALLHYDAEIEIMNLILLSIPNDIYNSMDTCTSAKDMWKRVERLMRQFEKQVNTSRAKKLEKSHDPLALVAHTGSSSRNTSSYYVTHLTSVVDYDDENNRLRTSSNTINQAVIQGDRVNIQSMNSGNAGRNNRRAYVQEEVVDGSNETGNVQKTLRNSSSGNTSTVQCYNCSGKGHFVRNCPKPRVQDSKYFMEQITIDDDQIDSNIIFDTPNGNVNSGNVEKDTHVPDLCAFEQLARNAYQEAEKQQIFAQKVQQLNKTLTSQLELYKEKVQVLENINEENNYLNEFLQADQRAKHFDQQAQSQFIHDRDII